MRYNQLMDDYRIDDLKKFLSDAMIEKLKELLPAAKNLSFKEACDFLEMVGVRKSTVVVWFSKYEADDNYTNLFNSLLSLMKEAEALAYHEAYTTASRNFKLQSRDKLRERLYEKDETEQTNITVSFADGKEWFDQ